MNHRFSISIAVAFMVGCSVFPKFDKATDHSLADRVDALISPLVAAHEFSGAVVMERDGHVVYSRGFGIANHAAGLAFTPETPADSGSLAKPFTAAGIWWLVHEGKIELDAPVQLYLPAYPHPQTTIRHLLSHSNGLPSDYEYFDPYLGKDEVRTTSAMLQVVAKQEPNPSFTPGTQYEYSNLGYDTAGLVIERVSGQSYEEFMRERFLSRLDMQSTFARPARFADWNGIRTEGYRWRDGTWQRNDSIDGEAFYGASNLYFSATDLARWGSANASGTAIPRAVFEAGKQPFTVAGLPLHVTGLSWYCDDREVRCNYTGSNAGFQGFLFWDRERNESVAFISNSTLPAWKIASLRRDLVNAMAGNPPDSNPLATFIEVYNADPAEIVGSYRATGVPTITLKSEQGGIKVQMGNGLHYDAFPASRQVLYVPGLDAYLAFSGTSSTRTLHLKSQELNLVARRS